MVLAKHHIQTDIISFEHHPYLYQLFKDNYSLYAGEMRNKIYIENITLGDKSEYYSLELNNKLSNPINNKQENNIREIKKILLDNYKFSTDKKISIIKINAEGRKLEILKGMKQIIQQHQPVLIFQNSQPLMNYFFSHKTDNQATVKFLNQLNYKVEQSSPIDLAYPKF